MKGMKLVSNPTPLWFDGIVIVRIVTGLLIAFHGVVVFMPDLMQHNSRLVEKTLLPFPLFTAYVGKIIELVCSLCLVAGLLTRLNAFLLSLVFAVLTFIIHDANVLNAETVHPFLFLLLCLMFLFVGPGRVSVDYKYWHDSISPEL